MILQNVSILNYKNIGEASMSFSPKVNCFTGRNGMGKTNILDAIYFLSFCKSFSSQPDGMVIRHGEDMLLLQGHYQRRGEQEDVSCGIQRGKRKVVKRNGKEYKRLSAHIGLLPVVMVSPLDWDLVRGGSEERRRLVDQIISQSDHQYLDSLIRYTRALENRNAMLRNGVADAILFESVEASMVAAAADIYAKRRQWIADFAPIFHRYYSLISGGSETVELHYQSQLDGNSMLEILNANRQRDLAAGYTTAGVHRDDIELMLAGYPMRKLGSQGQCKTYTIALRLAQFDFLKSHSGTTPLLLLDDIFDKLDASRVANIISVVSMDSFGQIFITDTDRTYLDEMISKSGHDDYKMFVVADGVVAETTNLRQ